MNKDYSFDFVVGTRANTSDRTKEILDLINTNKNDNKEDILIVLQQALISIGVLNRPLVVSMRVVGDDEFNNISKTMPTSIKGCCRATYKPTKFQHEPMTTLAMYFDDNDKNKQDINIADSMFNLGVGDIFKDFDVPQVITIVVNENDIVDMYEAYYKNKNDIEIFYVLVVESIRKLIPMFSISTLSNVLNGELCKYNKYTLSMLVTAIARMQGAQFNFCTCIDSEERDLRIAGYDKEIFINLEIIARSVAINTEFWMDSAILEARTGVTVGCEIMLDCLTGLQPNIANLPQDDERFNSALKDYYESLSELILMLSEILTAYIMDVSAEYTKDVYIGKKIPADKIQELTLKLKEVRARHKRIIQYSEVFKSIANTEDKVDDDTSLLEMGGYHDITRLAIDKLAGLVLDLYSVDLDKYGSSDDKIAAITEQLCKDILYVIETGKFADNCLTRDITTSDDLIEVEEFINELVSEYNNMNDTLNSFDTDEWMIAHEKLMEIYEK